MNGPSWEQLSAAEQSRVSNLFETIRRIKARVREEEQSCSELSCY